MDLFLNSKLYLVNQINSIINVWRYRSRESYFSCHQKADRFFMKFPLTPYTILQRHLYALFQNQSHLLLLNPVAPWCSGYHCCTTSFIKAWAQVLSRCKSCLRRVGDSRCWGSLTMVPAGNKAKRLSSVNYTTKTIHHHHHHQPCFLINISTLRSGSTKW